MDMKLYYDLAADVRYTSAYEPIRRLVSPLYPDVKAAADILRQSPDFIDASQEFVHSFTRYGHEIGDYWRTPAESLEDRFGIDCDDSAILLCSLLRNYLGPLNVFCAVGTWTVNGSEEGHMWVVVQDETGKDRIIESTAGPGPTRGTYNTFAIFNDQYAFATKEGLDMFDLRPIGVLA